MKSILLLAFLRIVVIECRVFCQDSHALSWMPLGFSCPLNCGNIITAVKRLKEVDYKKMFVEKLRYFNNTATPGPEIKILNTNYILNQPVRRSFNFVQSNTHKIFQDKKILKSLKVAMKMALNGSALKCPSDINAGKSNGSSCRRTYDHEEFIKKFTVLLNKYTDSEYQFTEEMTSIILEKILGTNMDLRHGLFDVKRILTYLSKAIRYHRTHTKQDLIIKLKSKHCLSVSVAGCYCKTGLVESSGQCVMPADCIKQQDTQYLERIILL